MRLRLLPLCVLLLTSGCSLSPGDDLDPGRSSICRQVPAEPLSVATTLEVLRAHGYDMTSHESNTTCKLDRVVAYLSNAPDPSTAPTPNVQLRGHVICDVESHDTNPAGALKIVPRTGKVAFYAENVSCTIYPRGDHQDQQVAALKTAMLQLAERAKPSRNAGETTP